MNRLETLWKYQELDLQMDQYIMEKKNSDSRQRLLKIKDYLVKQEKNLLDMDNNADKRLDVLARMEEEFNKLKDRIQTQMERLKSDKVLSLQELEEITKEGLILNDNIRRKEEELKKIKKEHENFQKKLNEIRRKVADAKNEYMDVKKDYDEEVKRINEKLLKLKEERDKIGESISKTLLAKYNNIKASKTPVISLLTDNQCDGCFMSLASLVVQRVKDGDRIVECENCGRILYYREPEENISS